MPQRSATLLTDAADLIDEFVGGLDRSEAVCGCCNRSSFANLSEARAAITLDALATKLKRSAVGFLKEENRIGEG